MDSTCPTALPPCAWPARSGVGRQAAAKLLPTGCRPPWSRARGRELRYSATLWCHAASVPPPSFTALPCHARLQQRDAESHQRGQCAAGGGSRGSQRRLSRPFFFFKSEWLLRPDCWAHRGDCAGLAGRRGGAGCHRGAARQPLPPQPHGVSRTRVALLVPLVGVSGLRASEGEGGTPRPAGGFFHHHN